jgi:ribonuclease VapC
VNGRVEYVLDATALIAIVETEPGYKRIEELLRNSTISAVNLAESANKLVERGAPAEMVRQVLVKLNLTVEDWTEEMAYRSTEFTRFNKSHGLSLGDRACLTLAKQLHATAVTSDRAWRRIPSLGVSVMIFR